MVCPEWATKRSVIAFSFSASGSTVARSVEGGGGGSELRVLAFENAIPDFRVQFLRRRRISETGASVGSDSFSGEAASRRGDLDSVLPEPCLFLVNFLFFVCLKRVPSIVPDKQSIQPKPSSHGEKNETVLNSLYCCSIITHWLVRRRL